MKIKPRFSLINQQNMSQIIEELFKEFNFYYYFSKSCKSKKNVYISLIKQKTLAIKWIDIDSSHQFSHQIIIWARSSLWLFIIFPHLFEIFFFTLQIRRQLVFRVSIKISWFFKIFGSFKWNQSRAIIQKIIISRLLWWNILRKWLVQHFKVFSREISNLLNGFLRSCVVQKIWELIIISFFNSFKINIIIYRFYFDNKRIGFSKENSIKGASKALKFNKIERKTKRVSHL